MSFDPNTPGAATPAPVAVQTPSAPITPQPAIAAPPVPQPTPVAPSEDRSNWVPPHRLREQSTRFEQQLSQERARYQAETEALNKRVQALAGLTPPADAEYDGVKNQFKQIFPELSEIGSQAEAIKELISLKDELRAAMQHQWASHNRNAMDRLFKNAETTYGNPLNDDAKRSLGSAFIGYLNTNPEAYERYQQDPSVVDEYWSAFTDRFIDPVRRQSTVATMNRIPAAIPLDAPSGGVPTSQAVKPANQDERLALALATYKAKSNQGF